MLPKRSDEIETGTAYPAVLEKECDGQDASRLGAFPGGASLLFRVRLPRAWGITGVLLGFAPDGGQTQCLEMSFSETWEGQDTYCLSPDFAPYCAGDGSGLFYYELIFLRAQERRYSDTENNLDFTLAAQSAGKFRLLFYRPDFRVPDWLGQGVMYHIFVDRFCRGAGDAPLHDDGVLDPDWDHGIPAYPEERGGALANNVFFGGNLWGVVEKLPYLASLGVTVLYLSPIFHAHSNHKYDTGDYERIDSSFGGEAAFDRLMAAAKAQGMRVILDGVFNHTGDDSRYFNRYGTYPEPGAYGSRSSPYYPWYRFRHWPDSYESWWGIPILPRLQQDNADCRAYFTGEGGIAERYLRRGADGWRLDVADELSDTFLEEFRARVQTASDGQGIVLGEVWENAADKIAYGKRRTYLRGSQLDSVMNYPLRAGILAFVQWGDAQTLYRVLTEIYASYPRTVSDSLMNLLGTHDTARVFTLLGADPEDGEKPNRELAVYRLSDEAAARACVRLTIAAVLQFTVYGIPSVYYGDEVATEGWHDPFCRMPFPWKETEHPVRARMLALYRRLGQVRREWGVFDHGDFAVVHHTDSMIAYVRRKGGEQVLVCANMGGKAVSLPLEENDWCDLLQETDVTGTLCVDPVSVRVIGTRQKKKTDGGEKHGL